MANTKKGAGRSCCVPSIVTCRSSIASNNADCVRGDAVDFCQTVTQVRNVADTRLEVTGPVANQWMSIAQCFAGGPVDPPKPGARGPRS